jgi:hypothetical protein
VNDRSEAEISEAVRECAQQCAQAADIEQCLSDFAAQLLALGWSEGDVEAVMRSARRVLDSIGWHLR